MWWWWGNDGSPWLGILRRRLDEGADCAARIGCSLRRGLAFGALPMMDGLWSMTLLVGAGAARVRAVLVQGVDQTTAKEQGDAYFQKFPTLSRWASIKRK